VSREYSVDRANTKFRTYKKLCAMARCLLLRLQAHGLLLMIVARRTDVRYLKGSWHETNRSPGFSIHTVVTRAASGGEQGGACTREGGRGQVGGKRTKKKSGAPVEAKGTLNDT
jgi:hypothetical protein